MYFTSSAIAFVNHMSYMTENAAVILTVRADKADIAVFGVGQAS
jgi:hypothetical protein